MTRDATAINPAIGWNDIPSNDPEVVKLRRYLEKNSGIRGQEILQPADIERAVELFRRDGLVVVENVLNSEKNIRTFAKNHSS